MVNVVEAREEGRRLSAYSPGSVETKDALSAVW